MIHTVTFPPYDGREHAGFHHLSTRPASHLNLGQGPSLQSSKTRGSQQWISIAGPGASGSGGLRCLSLWDIATGAHTHLTAYT
jgi:hypothetical protein